MAKADQIKALISSHINRDDEKFISTALQVAASEARQGRKNFALEIRDIIDSRKAESVKIVSISDDLADLIQLGEVVENASSLVLNSKLEGKLDRIVKEFSQAEKLAKHGYKNRRKILLSGPPGTGKTMTAAVLSKRTSLPFYVIQIDRLVTKYLGETGAKLRQIFAMIRKRPGVYLFDEFDAIGTQRGMENEVGEMRRVLNALLQFIEADHSRSLIIAATNNLSSLDVALFRRFDDVIHYEKPELPEIQILLKNRLGAYKGKINFDKVSDAAFGLSHAEITQACDDAIKETILMDTKSVKQGELIDTLNDRKHAYGGSIHI